MGERRRDTQTGGRAATQGVIPGGVALSVGDPGTHLPEGWRWTLLADVARLETGHTPSRKQPSYWDGDIPWIGIRDATANHGRRIATTVQFVTQAGIDNSSARVLPADTICLSRTASVGYVVEMGVPMATSQDFVNWVCGPELDHRYLKYVLLAEHDHLHRFASGTTHQTIYFPEVKAFHAALPPLPEQRRICDVLGALDDKVASNERMALGADALAQAECEARLTAGSRMVALEDVAAVVMGSSPPGSTYNEAAHGLPFFQGTRDFGFRSPTRRVYCSEPKRIAEPGDVLLSVRAPVGRLNVASERCAIGRGLAAVRAKHGSLLLHALRAYPEVWAPYEAEGTVFGSINGPALRSLSVRWLDPDHADAYEAVARPLDDLVAASMRQSETLSTLRHTLLPMLLSGELRVREAEERVEAVG